MEDDFRTIQKALETGDDTLFEVARQRLPGELASSVEHTRARLAEALAALVRLEAELLRVKTERGWTADSPLPVTRTTKG
ncbi:MAG: hypothetical protein ICCCNLDF_00403 [Planctomycetes bacterium]|nr:hypothetical protein [Planctomycetota bacterium]